MGTFNLDSVRMDAQKLLAGTWWRLGSENGRLFADPTNDTDDGPRILIVPKSAAYRRAFDEAAQPHREAFRDRTLPPEQEVAINATALGRAVFRGIKNVSVAGQEFVWSEEAGIALLRDPTWRELYDLVDALGNLRSVALAKEEAAAKGNLSAVSNGVENTTPVRDGVVNEKTN